MKNPSQAGPREFKRISPQSLRVEADGSFSGYASLFGRRDLGGDIVLPGAFAKSLRRRGAEGVRMLFQHDPDQPIGVWSEIREDRKGLRVSGRLAEGVEKAREILELLRCGAVDGLSIGFRTIRSRKDLRSKARLIEEADLWEVSIVTFPMLPDARVDAVKRAAKSIQQALAFDSSGSPNPLASRLRRATRRLSGSA